MENFEIWKILTFPNFIVFIQESTNFIGMNLCQGRFRSTISFGVADCMGTPQALKILLCVKCRCQTGAEISIVAPGGNAQATRSHKRTARCYPRLKSCCDRGGPQGGDYLPLSLLFLSLSFPTTFPFIYYKPDQNIL